MMYNLFKQNFRRTVWWIQHKKNRMQVQWEICGNETTWKI